MIQPSTSAAPGRASIRWILLAMVLVLSAGYCATTLKAVLIGYDDGALAQMATRVMDGEVPHRDFDELYTGGLTYLHAAAFKIFGASFATMRWVCFGVFLLWLPVVYWIALRFVKPLGAASVTLLATAWSYPNYTAPMPSWYNLFFATAGAAALLKYLEQRKRRWLVLAGVMAGLSVLVKVIGLYFLAGAFLVVAFDEQNEANADGGGKRTLLYSASLTLGLVVFVLLIVRLVRGMFGLAGFLNFVFPSAVICCFLIWREWKIRSRSSLIRFRRLALSAGALIAGTATPTGIFAAYMASQHALGPLFEGVFVRPIQRFSFAAHAPTPVFMLSLAAVVVCSFYLIAFRRICSYSLFVTLLIGFLGLLFWRTKTDFQIYAISLGTMLVLVPVVVAGGVARLARRHPWSTKAAGLFLLLLTSIAFWLDYKWFLRPQNCVALIAPVIIAIASFVQRQSRKPGNGAAAIDNDYGPASGQPATTYCPRKEGATALVMILSVCTLVQFPFSHPVYFFYVAPLAILAITGLVSLAAHLPRAAMAVLVVFFILFGAFRARFDLVNPLLEAHVETAPVQVPRAGGMRTLPKVAAAYDRLNEVIRQHANGEYIFAGPDAPEVYFLSGTRNPTRALFEFLDEPSGREERLLSTITAHHVNLIVINRFPTFSRGYSKAMHAELERRFPNSETVGRWRVRWR